MIGTFVKAINYYFLKVPSLIFERVLNTPLMRIKRETPVATSHGLRHALQETRVFGIHSVLASQ